MVHSIGLIFDIVSFLGHVDLLFRHSCDTLRVVPVVIGKLIVQSLLACDDLRVGGISAVSLHSDLVVPEVSELSLFQVRVSLLVVAPSLFLHVEVRLNLDSAFSVLSLLLRIVHFVKGTFSLAGVLLTEGV